MIGETARTDDMMETWQQFPCKSGGQRSMDMNITSSIAPFDTHIHRNLGGDCVRLYRSALRYRSQTRRGRSSIHYHLDRKYHRISVQLSVLNARHAALCDDDGNQIGTC